MTFHRQDARRVCGRCKQAALVRTSFSTRGPRAAFVRLVCSMLVLVWAATASAASWEGIDVVVDAQWPGCGQGGYFPIRVSVVNRGQPRVLDFKFEGRYGRIPSVTRRLSVQTERISFSLLVPCVGQETYGTLQVSVDGRHVADLSQPVTLPSVRDWTTVGPAVLLIDVNDTDWSGFKSAVEALTGASASASLGSGYTPSITAGDDHKAAPPDALPGEWQAYTGLDIVAVSLATLDRLDGDKRSALLKWVDTGGTLLVMSAPLEEASRIDAMTRGGAMGEGPAWTDSGPYRFRDQMLGRIVQVSVDPFRAFTVDEWRKLLGELGQQRWEWAQRHGFSARFPAPTFMEFLVPSVRGVPVMAFLVLITVFAIVIGPVNYLYLWKQRRLYLLIVTIPGIALVTSLSLFAYSVVAHGFSTRSRVRSLTVVDQFANSAAAFGRVSHYSGLAPSSLDFSRETAVYPIWPEGEGFESGAVDWTDRQSLESGWLRSRTRTQFFTVTHRRERGRMEVTPQAGTLAVSNGFEWDVAALVVSDDEGRWYFGENLPAGDAATLAPLSTNGIDQMTKLVSRDPLIAPPHAPAWGHAGGFGGPYGRWYGGYFPPTLSYTVNLSEQVIQHLTVRDYYEPNPARTRCYAAVLAENPDIETGVPGAREEASLHVLVGTY